MTIHAVHTVSTLRADFGGPSRSISALCTALATHAEIELISFGRGPSEEAPVLPRSEKVRVVLLEPQRPISNTLIRVRLFRRAVEAATNRAAVPRLLHDHGMWWQTNHATAIAARRGGIPRVVSPRGMISSWAMNYHRARKQLAWKLYQAHDLHTAQLLHATSQDEAEDARRLGLRIPVAVIPNGVELPHHVQARRRETEERRALFLSRIHPKKGLAELVAAWARVRPANWKLMVAGPDEGGHLAEVEALVRREKLESQVQFLGSVANEDKWRIYESADLFILPTFSENFGIVIAEALGMGLPVITTTGAPWRALREQQLGWWIDVGVEPLIAAIREATSLSDAERCQLGRRGREFVKGEFSWESIGERMVAAYRWLCGVGPQSDDIQHN